MLFLFCYFRDNSCTLPIFIFTKNILLSRYPLRFSVFSLRQLCSSTGTPRALPTHRPEQLGPRGHGFRAISIRQRYRLRTYNVHLPDDFQRTWYKHATRVSWSFSLQIFRIQRVRKIIYLITWYHMKDIAKLSFTELAYVHLSEYLHRTRYKHFALSYWSFLFRYLAHTGWVPWLINRNKVYIYLNCRYIHVTKSYFSIIWRYYGQKKLLIQRKLEGFSVVSKVN